MKVWSDNFADGAAIPVGLAFGKHDPQSHVALSTNRNPHVAWSDVPEAARSLVLVCHDVDVPSRGDDVNQEGKRVPADLPRVDFYHWLLVDIPTSQSSIAEGAHSDGITARGKDGPAAAGGMRHGVNDYTGWFAGDADMSGTYFGYDGPCPPWNDTIVHHYHFTLYALDVEKAPVEGEFGGAGLLEAIGGHVIDKASFMGTYTIAPDAEDRG